MRRFTAIVIVIAVALASASCTTGPSSPSGPTLATATSTSLATAIASATASAPSPPLSGWIAHPIAEIGNTPIAALGGGADGFIAILRAGTGLTELRSSDGIAWTAVSAKGTVPNNGFLYDIGGGRWLGVGTAYPSTGSVTLASARVSAPRSGATLASSCEGPSPDAAIWESADGVTWSRVPEQASLKAWSIAALAPGGPDDPGLWAVGGLACPVNDQLLAAVWHSKDRSRWTLLTDPSLADGFMSDALVDGAELITVGDGYAPTRHPTVWRFDIETPAWKRLTLGGDGGLQGIAFGTVGPDRHNVLVAIGTFGSGETVTAWTSPDGFAWTPVADPTLTLSDIATVPSSRGDWFVGSGQGGIWTSADGVSWTHVVRGDDTFSVGPTVFVGPHGPIVVDVDNSGGVVVWTGPTTP